MSEIIPYLSGKYMSLEPLAEKHAEVVAKLNNDLEVTNLMFMGTFPTTKEDCCVELDQLRGTLPGPLQSALFPTKLVFAVINQSDGLQVGTVGLYGINWVMATAEIRALFFPTARGKIVHETYRIIISYVFGKLNLRRLQGGYVAGHAASSISVHKVGFVKEGCFREAFFRCGVTYDLIPVGLLARDFYAKFPDELNKFKATWDHGVDRSKKASK